MGSSFITIVVVVAFVILESLFHQVDGTNESIRILLVIFLGVLTSSWNEFRLIFQGYANDHHELAMLLP
jgi:hypothetical protein